MTRDERRAWRDYVFGCEQLTVAERFVLLALETYADYPAGTNARPGRVALATKCKLGTRVVDSALALGEQLRLIEQTARANPKAHIAATYRLISTRTTVRTEDVSSRTTVRAESGFNSQESDFNSQDIGVSTRTVTRHTNPLIPIHPYQEGAARASASDAQLPAIPDSHPPPVIGKQANIIDDAELIDDVEPQPYCDAHMPSGTDAKCGACQRRREIRQNWIDRQRSARLQRIWYAYDARQRERQRDDLRQAGIGKAPRQELGSSQPRREPTPLSVDCPTCRAPAFTACRTPGTRYPLNDSHRERVDAAHAAHRDTA